MADITGYSFSPATSDGMTKRMNTALPQNAGEALRVLSLNLPSILSGRVIAPDALLSPAPRGGGPVPAVPLPPAGGTPAPFGRLMDQYLPPPSNTPPPPGIIFHQPPPPAGGGGPAAGGPPFSFFGPGGRGGFGY